MTKHYTLLLLFLFPTIASAQSWNCVQAGKRVYFSNGSYLRGMRIDSVTAIGMDTVFYPYRTPRGKYAAAQVLDTNGGGWLGRSIVRKPNGLMLFTNAYNDTIKIETQAGIGAGWIFYDDATGISYQATVTAVDTMTIDNVIDSVKTIRFQAFNGTLPIAGDSVNNYELVLSKSHGIIKAFDFYNFPYHEPGQPYQRYLDYYLDLVGIGEGAMFSRVNFQNPLYEEIYDFKAGSVLQYNIHYPFNAPGTKTIKINSRVDMPADITYNIDFTSVQLITSSGQPYYSTTSSTHNWVVRKGTFKIIDTVLMPEEYRCGFIYFYNYKSVSHCRTSSLYRLATSAMMGNRVNTFEPCGKYQTYRTGLGSVDSTVCINPLPGDGYDERLTYTKIDSVACGNYNPLSTQEIKQPSPQIFIYPQPADEILNLILPDGMKSGWLNLLDMTGRTVLRKEIFKSVSGINVSIYPAGLYMLAFKSGFQSVQRKIQIVH